LANKNPITKTNANRLGKAVTDNTISASYIVRKAAGKPVKVIRSIIKVMESKFRSPVRRSKLPKGTRVERRKRRLDTRGEKRGITVARYLAKRKKKRVVRRKKR